MASYKTDVNNQHMSNKVRLQLTRKKNNNNK